MGYNEDVEALTTKLENTLISYHSLELDQWRVAKMTKDVTVWRRPSEEFHGYLYKAEGLVKDSPSRIIDFIRPGPCRLRWDSLMTSMDIVNTIDQSRCVMRYTTAGQLWGLISPREFVDLSFTTPYKTGLLSCGLSVEDPAVVERPGAVRGFNHPCGWFCVPTYEEEGSLLTGYVQTELRGKIPQSAVDAAMGNTLVNFYTDLNKVLRE